MRMKSQLSLIISFQVETSLTIVLFLLLSPYYYPTMISAEQGGNTVGDTLTKVCAVILFSLSSFAWFSLSALHCECNVNDVCCLGASDEAASHFSQCCVWGKTAFVPMSSSLFLNVAAHFLLLLSRRGHCPRSIVSANTHTHTHLETRGSFCTEPNCLISKPIKKYRFTKEMCFLELYICTCNWGKLL